MNRIGLRLLVLLLICVLTACGTSGPGPAAAPEMRVSLENGQTVYNGTEQDFYTVKQGQTGELRISVRTESGSLGISVFPSTDPEHFCYRGTEIPTSDFSVTLPEAGDYTVWIEAEHFAGSYEFGWTAY